jgi:hypothetical protein
MDENVDESKRIVVLDSKDQGTIKPERKCSQCARTAEYKEKHVCVICNDYFCDKCIHKMHIYHGFFESKYCVDCTIVFG